MANYNSVNTGATIDNMIDMMEKIFKIFIDGSVQDYHNDMILQIKNKKLAWVKAPNVESQEVVF